MRTLIVILAGIGLALADEAGSQPRGSKAAPGVGSRAGAAEAPAAPGADDIRDVLLLLDHGPLHLRFRMTLEGVSLGTAREAYVDRLMKSLDTNGDGKISPEEAANSPIKTTRGRGKGAAFLATLDGERLITRKTIMQDVERAGGETVVYRQDSSSSNNDLEVFKFLD